MNYSGGGMTNKIMDGFASPPLGRTAPDTAARRGFSAPAGRPALPEIPVWRRIAALLALCTSLASGSVLAQDAVEPPRPADIDPLTSAQFAEILDAHRGVVTLVNLWATWCAPCLREIPELLELESHFADRGFHLIAVSLDDADAADMIREFRDEWFPELRTWHNQTQDWYELIESLDPEWIGILPTSFLLDRNGVVVDTITGGQDYATFEAAVLPHL